KFLVLFEVTKLDGGRETEVQRALFSLVQKRILITHRPLSTLPCSPAKVSARPMPHTFIGSPRLKFLVLFEVTKLDGGRETAVPLTLFTLVQKRILITHRPLSTLPCSPAKVSARPMPHTFIGSPRLKFLVLFEVTKRDGGRE